MVFGNGVKNILAAAYNGARTVLMYWFLVLPLFKTNSLQIIKGKYLVSFILFQGAVVEFV